MNNPFLVNALAARAKSLLSIETGFINPDESRIARYTSQVLCLHDGTLQVSAQVNADAVTCMQCFVTAGLGSTLKGN